MITIYQYPRCSTCRRALKWLDDHQVPYQSVNLVEKPPSKARLKEILARNGLPVRRLFNTSGQSYREGGFKERLAQMSEADALAALAADGKLIKRPIAIGEDFALVGFQEEAYRSQFAG